MKPADLDDIADDGEDLANDLNTLHTVYLSGDVLVEATQLLDRIMDRFGKAVDWHNGIHFEGDFDPSAIEH